MNKVLTIKSKNITGEKMTMVLNGEYNIFYKDGGAKMD